jgi:hypothetical protein
MATKKAAPNKVSSDFDKSREQHTPAPEPKFGKVPTTPKPVKMPPMTTFDQGVRDPAADSFGKKAPHNPANGG